MVKVYALLNVALRSGYYTSDQGTLYVLQQLELLFSELSVDDRYYGSQLMVRLRRSSGRGL
jgi:hypothetical protein